MNERLDVRWISAVSDLAAGSSDVNNSEMKLAEWERSNRNNKTLHVFIPEFLHAAAGEAVGPRTSYRCRWNIKEQPETNTLVSIGGWKLEETKMRSVRRAEAQPQRDDHSEDACCPDDVMSAECLAISSWTPARSWTAAQKTLFKIASTHDAVRGRLSGQGWWNNKVTSYLR